MEFPLLFRSNGRKTHYNKAAQKLRLTLFRLQSHIHIVLLALVDANYKVIYVDVGCNGRISDISVYRNSSLSDNATLGIPQPRFVGETLLPYVIVADDAFPLKTNLMKPYCFSRVQHEKCVINY